MSTTTVSSSMITDATILNADIGAAAAIATTKLGAGATVQFVNVLNSAVATGTTVAVLDDTIPQKTEGDEYMTLAITPTHASNKLFIEVNCVLSTAVSSGFDLITSLFQDDTANALATVHHKAGGSQSFGVASFNHCMTAGTVSETTFKVRSGCNAAGTTTFNGSNGSRYYGGVQASSITITEIKV